MVLSIETASSLTRTICSRCRCSNTLANNSVFGPAVHAGVDGMPSAKPRRQSPPLATMLSNIQDCIEHPQIRNAYIAALYWKERCDAFVLVLCEFHAPMITYSTPIV